MSTAKPRPSFVAPTFQWYFLSPKYWFTWLTILVLYVLSWLPLSWQIVLGKVTGRLLMKVMKKRYNVAIKNIELCFPDMPQSERHTLVVKNFENAGIALFESGIAWWWPSWRAKKVCKVKGQHHIDDALAAGKGVFLLFFHIFPLEMMARVLGENDYGLFTRPRLGP